MAYVNNRFLRDMCVGRVDAKQLRVQNDTFINGDTQLNGDVVITGDLVVNGSTATLEVNNLEAIEELQKRLNTLEKENKKLASIVTRLQYHPDSPFVADVAEEWNEKYQSG